MDWAHLQSNRRYCRAGVPRGLTGGLLGSLKKSVLTTMGLEPTIS